MGVRAGSAPRPDGNSACTGSARPTLFVRVLSVALAALILGGVVLIPQEVEALSTQVDSPTVVPGGSVLVPEGLATGDRFRVLFLTSGERKADSADIGVYNAFVQAAAAGGHESIAGHSGGFRAVASTADVDARDNTATTGAGVPIYWLGADKIADDYADFYDEDWDDETGVTDESASAYTGLTPPRVVWTGSDDDGTVEASAGLGTSEPRIGHIGVPSSLLSELDPLDSGEASTNTNTHPLYALSEVFTVGPTVVPGGSVLVPEGLATGDRFRVLFLTSGGRKADSADIGVYNAFVQAAAAGGHESIAGHSGGFRAVASTADVDARDNTATTGAGVPIYWLGADKIADDYADFYDEDWDDETGVTDESASAYTGLTPPRVVWTGSDDDGTVEASAGLGTSEPRIGHIGVPSSLLSELDPLDSGEASTNTNTHPLYALSEVFTVGPTVSVSQETLSVVEGSSASYMVVLDAEPSDDVSIDIAGGGDVTVEPASLAFTAETWDMAQTVTVSAAEDSDAVDDFQTVTHAVTSDSAGEFVGLSVDSVAVTVDDNDAAGVSVSPEALSVVEGSSAVYAVVLDAEPSGDVTVDISGGGDVTVEPASVSFAAATWDTAQSVTVSAAEDSDVLDDFETVTHAVASDSAGEFVGLSVDSVVVTVDDNDAAGVSVSRRSLSVDEGASGSYTVRLTFQPASRVTVDVAGGGDVTAEPASLVFTAETWDMAQSVTVSADEDSDAVDDLETVTHTVAGDSAPEYVGLSVDSVAVTVVDNDVPDVTVRFEQESYTVSEGDSVTVRVRLSTNPRRTVDVPLVTTEQGGASQSDYSGVPSSVRFPSGATVRSFTFTAAADAVDEHGESVRIGFGALPAKVTAGAASAATVSIADANRAPTASAAAEPATVYAGETVTLRGTAGDPDGDALAFLWTSDSGGEFVPDASVRSPRWIAPATDTAFAANLTLTVTDEHGLSVSATISVVVEPTPLPNAATGLRAVVSDDNSVLFDWAIPAQPRGVTIDSVQVQQRDSRGVYELPVWDTVATLAGPVTHRAVTALAADTEYVFRIRLTSNHGLWADSAALRVRTPTEAPAPRSFWAQWPTQTSITLRWSTVETAAEYRLEYRKDGETGWTGVAGDFDDLPSSSDLRWGLGVAAGLDCNTGYEFRVSVRGSGEERADSRRLRTTFGPHSATLSATTGECAQPERVTNLLVSVEPDCATLTWTPPSGGRDTGYRVERYGYTGRASGDWQRMPRETLVEQPDQIAARYEDCSQAYGTEGADHVWVVTALDNDPGPGEQGAFGSAYTPLLVYGPSGEPEPSRNVRLALDTRLSRELVWDAPQDPWLTTVKTARETARAGAGPQQPQQVATGPWVTGYRVERREYRTTGDGDWYLPETDPIWSAEMTVGSSTSNTPAKGYSGTAGDAFGAMTQTAFAHPAGGGGHGRSLVCLSPPASWFWTSLRRRPPKASSTAPSRTGSFGSTAARSRSRSDCPKAASEAPASTPNGRTPGWAGPTGSRSASSWWSASTGKRCATRPTATPPRRSPTPRTKGTASTSTGSGPTTQWGLSTTPSTGPTGPSTADTRAETLWKHRRRNSDKAPNTTRRTPGPPTTRRRPTPRPPACPPSPAPRRSPRR